MATYESVDEILDFAIQNEQEAHDFYMQLAQNMTRPAMKETFEQFAHEELGHKAKLEHIKAGGAMKAAEGKVRDLGIADYVVGDAEPSPQMTYQEALIVAMNAEKRAFKLYTDLAGSTDDPGLRELFLGLAQEEAKHKLRFEIEYDEYILTEN